MAAVREAGLADPRYLPVALGEGSDFQQAGARAFAFSLARTFAAGLLLEQAQWSARHKDDARDVAVARRWCRQRTAPLLRPTPTIAERRTPWPTTSGSAKCRVRDLP